MNGILVIAHAPLASALRQAVLHVLPDAEAAITALDVPADQAPEHTLAQAQALMQGMATPGTLVLTDIFGATPCNVCSRLVDGVHSRLLSGVNLPMLLRAVSYRHEPLDALVTRAMLGATQGVMPVNVTAPQNQNSRHRSHAQNYRDHQQ
jgi:PTS system ascorbate-specific IIA component